MNLPHTSTGLKLLALAVSLFWFTGGGGSACSRASNEELLQGKACQTQGDCISGYSCDPSLKLCVVNGMLTGSAGGSISSGLGGMPSSGGSLGGRVGSSGGTLGTNLGGSMAMSSGGASSGGDASGGASSGGDASGGTSALGGASSGGATNSGGTASASGGSTSGGAGSAGAPSGGTGSGGMPSGGTGGTLVCSPSCATGRACVNGKCASGWITTATPPAQFVGRSQAAYTQMGGKLFIWGGKDQNDTNLDSGAIYDPQTDTWATVPVDAETPSARVLANAAWTGTQVIVWGGRSASGSTDYKDGALYDPISNAWKPMAAGPTARSAAITFASGNFVFFTLGWTRAGALLDKGERYQLIGNTWTNAANDLLARREQVGWAIDGSQLYVVGGRLNGGNVAGDSAFYDTTTNQWSSLPTLPAPRYGAFVTHAGTQLWMWGGRHQTLDVTAGFLLNNTTWSAISRSGEPSGRWAAQRQSGWAFVLPDGRSALVAGLGLTGFVVLNGGIYNPSNDTWSAIGAWPSNKTHEWGVGAWVAGQFVLWGGSDVVGNTTALGERWAP